MITNKALPFELSNKTSENYFSSLISAAITFVLTIAAIAFFFWFIWGGIKWITSSGDKMRAEEARKTITQALVGLVLLISTWAILSLIESIFGVNITSISFSDFYIK